MTREPQSPDGDVARERDVDRLVETLMTETGLWQTFLAAHRVLLQRMSAQMAQSLPLQWFDVLIHLAMEPTRSLRQIALTERVLLSESGTSRMLTRMAEAGLLTRSQDPADRRGVVVTLTAEGEDILRAVTASHVALVNELFTDALGPDEAAMLGGILSRLIERAGRPSA